MKKRRKIGLGFSPEDIDLLAETNIYFMLLMMLASNRFKWKNLPDTIDERFLELTLLRNGRAVIFNSESFGFMCLPFTETGDLNYYYYPKKVQPYTIGNYNFPTIPLDECALVYNDNFKTTPYLIIAEYAKKLSNVSDTLDINTKGLRTPMLGLCEESQKYTFEKLFDDIADGKPKILASKNLDLDSIKVLPTITPQLVDSITELRGYKKDIWFEAMTYLGIENSNIEKKERMITGEVESNNAQTNMFKEIGLVTRKEACEKANRLWGLDISVEYRSNVSRETLEGDDSIE